MTSLLYYNQMLDNLIWNDIDSPLTIHYLLTHDSLDQLQTFDHSHNHPLTSTPASFPFVPHKTEPGFSSWLRGRSGGYYHFVSAPGGVKFKTKRVGEQSMLQKPGKIKVCNPAPLLQTREEKCKRSKSEQLQDCKPVYVSWHFRHWTMPWNDSRVLRNWWNCKSEAFQPSTVWRHSTRVL